MNRYIAHRLFAEWSVILVAFENIPAGDPVYDVLRGRRGALPQNEIRENAFTDIRTPIRDTHRSPQ